MWYCTFHRVKKQGAETSLLLSNSDIFPSPFLSLCLSLRVRVVSCLLDVGRVTVIMSDADALWLGDPTQALFGGAPFLPPGGGGGDGRRGDRIRDSDVVASRATYPYDLGEAWGSTICMGFILLRTKNTRAMKAFLDAMEGLVLETGDDQVHIL